MNRELSGRVSTASLSAGSKKLGHPVPESNLVSELNSSCPQPLQRYMPSSLLSQYVPVNARSVPFLRSTSYSSGLSSSRHSCSVFSSFSNSSSDLRLHRLVAPRGRALRGAATIGGWIRCRPIEPPAPRGTEGGIRILRPLRIRDFALLFGGTTVSLFGDGIYIVALAWQVYDLSNVPTALSVVGVAWTLPMVAFLRSAASSAIASTAAA